MGRQIWLISAGLALSAGVLVLRTPAPAQERPAARLEATQLGFLLRFGSPDGQPTWWSGKVTVEGGSLVRLQPWRFAAEDRIQPPDGFSCRVRRAQQPGVIPFRRALADNGVLVVMSGPGTARVQVSTNHGDFSFTAGEIPLGVRPERRLNGLVTLQRVPVPEHVTTGPTEDDFPAVAAAPDGTLWIAYIAYTNGRQDRTQIHFQYSEPPQDFDHLATPPGGDQLWVLRYQQGKRDAPVPLTAPRQDLYRCAVALDGQQRPVVVWSENRKGNWDLYARTFDGERWLPAVRITRSEGPDLHPVLATDARGRVWLAWQRFGREQSDIAAAFYAAGAWSEPIVIADSPANEWDPVVATDGSGNVAFAWDTYQKGDYDVMLRVRRARPEGVQGEPLGDPIPVATTLAFEARPALAYDRAGRLWVAWEQMPDRWGKDFGYAVRDKGRGLYQQGPQVQVRVYQDGQRLQSAQAPGEGWLPGLQQANSFVRLAADAQGRVWLLFRHREPLSRGPAGTVWLTYATSYDGEAWSDPVPLPNTDGVGDCRPALARDDRGTLYVVQGSDARQHRSPGEPLNFDVWISLIHRSGGRVAPVLVPEPASAPVAVEPSTEPEDVARARAYRLRVNDRIYRLWRGEFHRHTEISPDGGGDGPLIDMFRYALDAARMDWIGNGDHDNGGGREYSWWLTQKLADAFLLPRHFTPMFSYERSVRYPDGHRNVMFARRGIRTLPRLVGEPPHGVHADDTKMLYRMLRQFDGICAVHTSATSMGTDWRNNDPLVEPVVEIYQGARTSYEGPGQPRVAAGPDDSPGGWEPAGMVWNALDKGIRLGFQSSSDHGSTHISYAVALVEQPTREGVLDAFRKRHCYAATDNVILEVRSGDHLMGDEFSTRERPYLLMRVLGTDAVARIDVVKGGKVVYSTEPKQKEVRLMWKDPQPTPGFTSYYYVRALQANGEIAWGSPMWIRYQP
ncbi:MAG: hypothetical protein HY320_09270 [Armatimonadetes bacterium]|nr:hypothetical protein [Armatimonadota bacterium]